MRSVGVFDMAGGGTVGDAAVGSARPRTPEGGGWSSLILRDANPRSSDTHSTGRVYGPGVVQAVSWGWGGVSRMGSTWRRVELLESVSVWAALVRIGLSRRTVGAET